MAWPNDYIAGSIRQLPDNPNIYALSNDSTAVIGGVVYDTYPTIAAWVAARIFNKNLVLNAAGEILVVPSGTVHEEIVDSDPVNINPDNDSSQYFACIVGEDPANKPTLNFTNPGTNPPLSDLGALILFKYSKLIDVIFTYSTSRTENVRVIQLGDGNGTADSMAIGCIAKDIVAPNTSSHLYVFAYSTRQGCVCCVVDDRNIVGGGPPASETFGFSNDFAISDAYAINCVANNMTWSGFSNFQRVFSLYNCCSQGCINGPNIGGNPGSVKYVCADGEGLDMTGGILNTADDQGIPMTATPYIATSIPLSFYIPPGAAPGLTLQAVWTDTTSGVFIDSYDPVDGSLGGTFIGTWENPPTPTAYYTLTINYWDGDSWEPAGYSVNNESQTLIDLPVLFTDDLYGNEWNVWDRAANNVDATSSGGSISLDSSAVIISQLSGNLVSIFNATGTANIQSQTAANLIASFGIAGRAIIRSRQISFLDVLASLPLEGTAELRSFITATLLSEIPYSGTANIISDLSSPTLVVNVHGTRQFTLDLQYWFNKFVNESKLNKYKIHGPGLDEERGGTFIELLFNDSYDDSSYIYMYREVTDKLSWPSNAKRRMMVKPINARYYIGDENGSINLYGIQSDDLTLFDKLLEYRLTSTTDISGIDYESLTTNLSKMVYIYLELKLNNDYSRYNQYALMSAQKDLLECCFEVYLVENIFTYISNQGT